MIFWLATKEKPSPLLDTSSAKATEPYFRTLEINDLSETLHPKLPGGS